MAQTSAAGRSRGHCHQAGYKKRETRPQTLVKRVDWKCHLKIDLDGNAVAKKIWLGSSLVLAINFAPQELDEWAVHDTYKAQSVVEPGFRFIKNQTFFADVLFWRRPFTGEASAIAGRLHGPTKAPALIDCLWADHFNLDSAADLEPPHEMGISTV